MRYLLLSSLLLMMVWVGCSLKLQPVGTPISTTDIRIFKDTTGTYLYKNKIELYGNYLSGLMMIKTLPNNNYKVAMTTEFGAKIMDFEITDGQFIMHDVIEQMRRKRILQLIETDMKLLFVAWESSGITTTDAAGNKVTAYKGKPMNGLYTSNYLGEVISIDGYQKQKKVLESTIGDYHNGVPKTLKVNHLNMPVQIEMTLIKAPGYAPE